MDASQADLLIKQGFSDVHDIAALGDVDLSDLLGINVDRAKLILESLRKMIEEEKKKKATAVHEEEKSTEVKDATNDLNVEQKESTPKTEEPVSAENNDTKE
jgi:hypothetical protein